MSLRAFLRQDPDIIMVGEIRDFETAEIAVKAALTGHMVLSTLHTNDAPATISRLLNMGVEPFLITASVNLVWRNGWRARSATTASRRPSSRRLRSSDIGFDEEQIAGGKMMKGGLPDLQRHGLQGARRALRGHALHRLLEGKWCFRGLPPRSSRRRPSSRG